MGSRGWLLFHGLVYYLTFLKLLTLCDGTSDAMESPQYIVIRTAADMEIRLYKESSWMSALVRGGTSFKKFTHDGFHRFSINLTFHYNKQNATPSVHSRLYQYIHGANSNSIQINITSPILTTISQATHGSDYLVKLYLPEKHELTPPQQNPELNLHLNKSKTRCIVVRKFTGYAEDNNISKELDSLEASFSKIFTGKAAVLDGKKLYTVAQYNASFHASGRLNEVWVNVSGFTAEGCPSN